MKPVTYWDVIKILTNTQRKLPDITPVNREELLPLSYPQQRMWFLNKLYPSSTSYNMCSGFRIKGKLDFKALEDSINAVIKRHEILRTVFYTHDGKPYQNILPNLIISLNLKDFSSIESKEDAALSWISKEAKGCFDLSKGSLIRCSLAIIDSQEYYFLMVIHHILADGWSIGIIYEEIRMFYEAYSKNENIDMPHIPVQYADFACWQQINYDNRSFDGQLEYWKNKLANASKILELPTDWKRPPFETNSGSIRLIKINNNLTKELKKLKKIENGTTVFMVLLAAFRVLLFRYSNNEDFIIGSTISNRNRRETKNLVGFLTNTITLYTNLSGNPNFLEVLKREKETCLDAYCNQDFPFEILVDQLQPIRDQSRNPLFQVMFTFQNVPRDKFKLEDLEIQQIIVENSGAMFDLLISLVDRGESIDGRIEYNRDLFSEETIERFSQHYLNILKSIIINPSEKISELKFLSYEEENKVLFEWNKTEEEYSENLCIHNLFEMQVNKAPNSVALVHKGKALSYNELNIKANKLAAYLLRIGVKEKSIVGISMERSFEVIIGLLAILKCGATYVFLDPSLPHGRMKLILTDCNIKVIITKESFKEKFDRNTQLLICLDADSYLFEEENGLNLCYNNSENTAYIIYTSGTTGVPKGVKVNHKSVINVIQWVNKTFNVCQDDQILFITSISFDLSVYDIFGMLAAGGSIYIPHEDLIRDPEELISIIKNNPISIWDSTPAAMIQLIPFMNKIKSGEGNDLRLVLLSGDWIPVNLPDTIKEYFKKVQVIALGGATEATIWSNYFEVKEVNKKWCSIPYGRPIQNSKYYILDQNMKPCPVGVPGYLYIGGKCLSEGYLNQQELTNKKFLPDMFSNEPDSKIYYTGDRARFQSDGNIEFLGRTDGQVKVNGFRIELEEIKTVICQHIIILNAVVTTKEISSGDIRIIAYVVLKENEQLRIKDIRNFLKDRLPAYMVPAFIIKIDTIPVTSNGKTDLLSLPEIGYGFHEKIHEEPQTHIEKVVSRFWCEELKINKVDLKDNFFELGGSSILVIKIVSKINEAFNIKLPIQEFFAAENLRELAQKIVNCKL